MKKIIIPVAVVAALLLAVMLVPGDKTLLVKWTPAERSVKDARPLVDVYLENSGSMDGYMNDGAQLKDAVYSYVSALESYAAGTPRLHFINSQVVPYEGAAKDFIRNMNPETFRRAGGSRANSDIAQMLETIVGRLSDNSIAVFISDCILDVPEGDAEHFFINRQIDIRNAFAKGRRKRPDLSVVMMQLESEFTGMYYYNTGGEELRGKMRPYYMFLIGRKELLAGISKRVPPTAIKHGVEHCAAFTTRSDVPFTMTNEFGVARRGVAECRQGKDGRCRMKIEANFLPTLQDDDYVMNPDNYRTQNATVSVSTIERMNDTGSPYTHVLTVEMDGRMNPAGELIRLVQQPMPSWIEAANDDSGREINKHLKQTTGIKYIVSGIAEAFREETTLADFAFNIQKK